eukprot:m.30361 g.30361  ORF g.30361 m.30361 type:complete len:513 (+) comp10601_c0_seq1:104-1642(+)
MGHEEPFIIGLIGLPSAGKSTLANSLAKKRILDTGVCRTTKDVHLIGHTNVFGFNAERFHEVDLVSDDGVRYMLLDLPGVADAEGKVQGQDKTFDEMTAAWIEKCNLVLWVTDTRTAFLTTHEQKEFDNIRSQLARSTKETGTFFQVGIVLSKYECGQESCEPPPERETSTSPAESESAATGELPDEDSSELEDNEEDTTIADCCKRVEGLYPDRQAVPIIKFNAFGRCLHHDKISEKLRRFVKKQITLASKAFTTFNLKWATQDLVDNKEGTLLQFLVNFQAAPLIKAQTSWWANRGQPAVAAPLQADVTQRTTKFKETALLLKTNKARTGLFRFLLGLEAADTLKTDVNLSATDKNWLCSIIGLEAAYHELVGSIEQDILAQVSPDVVYRLTVLLGAQNLSTCRAYLILSGSKVDQNLSVVADHMGKQITFQSPRRLSAVDSTLHHEWFQLDIDFVKNRTLSCFKDWIDAVRQKRQTLWGASSESCLEISMVLLNAWHGTLPSVLAQVTK